MPEVSIVIPSYNHAAYIETAVLSVLDQTWHDLELIIVDDGSQDDTLKVLAGIKDQRLRIFAQDNQGAHAAINRGLSLASGDFLGILNSDDAYAPQRLATLIPAISANENVGLVGSYLEVMNEHGDEISIKRAYYSMEPWELSNPEKAFRARDHYKDALLTENYFVTTSNFLFTRDLWNRVGQFRPLRFAHDWDFLLRAARITELQVIAEPLLKYRVHPTNTINEDKSSMVFEICWILGMHLPKSVDDEWFNRGEPAERIEQLLNSIYCFGKEQVLVVLLLQGIAVDGGMAMDLLDPDNKIRRKYLEYISDNLES